jgi:hypothetical protein
MLIVLGFKELEENKEDLIDCYYFYCLKDHTFYEFQSRREGKGMVIFIRDRDSKDQV